MVRRLTAREKCWDEESLRPSAEGPQMTIAQIEVQVKRNSIKTLAQIINRVNNLDLDVSSDPEVYHRRTRFERRFRSRQPVPVLFLKILGFESDFLFVFA
jgi:hypothetical protein